MRKHFMTIGEAAVYLRLSRETLYKYVQRGVVPAAKIGKHWRFDEDAVNAWVSAQTSPGAPAARPVPPKAPTELTRRMNVLVVDDDSGIRTLLEIWIRAEGHAVESAGNGAGAMQKLTTSTYDLVFLDLQMPDLTGGQVLGRLQEYDNRPPVVLITGFAGTPLMEQALHYDLLYVLSKPFERQQVLRLLHSVQATNLLDRASPAPTTAEEGGSAELQAHADTHSDI